MANALSSSSLQLSPLYCASSLSINIFLSNGAAKSLFEELQIWLIVQGSLSCPLAAVHGSNFVFSLRAARLEPKLLRKSRLANSADTFTSQLGLASKLWKKKPWNLSQSCTSRLVTSGARTSCTIKISVTSSWKFPSQFVSRSPCTDQHLSFLDVQEPQVGSLERRTKFLHCCDL